MLNFSFGKQKIKILLLEGANPSAAEAFKAAGYENIDYHPAALPQDELLKKSPMCILLGFALTPNSTLRFSQPPKNY